MKKRFLRILYHIGGWVLLYLLPLLALQSEIRLPQDFGDFMWWAIVIICFYINYLWLVPKILIKRKFAQYFSLIFLMLLFTYSVNEIYIRQVHRAERDRKGISEQRDDRPRKRWPRFRSYNSALFCFAVLALGTSIKVTESWYENEKQRKEMENQKLGAELSLLKSQINPHFFFNTLNSIYSLAIIKSDKTPEAVIKLSEIMRYIIYDTERRLVPLSSEVEYIRNYIELQRLRLSSQVHVELKTRLSKEESVIEPLLLLPFIENAFKHGIDNEKGGTITVIIEQEGSTLTLHVENPLVEINSSIKGPSGIGMTNTLKRLKLLYQDNYKLIAGPVEKSYVIDLVLKLKEDELHDS